MDRILRKTENNALSTDNALREAEKKGGFF